MRCVLCQSDIDENGCCKNSHLHWRDVNRLSLLAAIEELQRRLYFLIEITLPKK